MVASERRYKEEIELLKAKVVQQKREFDRKKEHLKEDMSRRQKQVLDDNKQLQNSLASKKEEVEVLHHVMQSIKGLPLLIVTNTCVQLAKDYNTSCR